MLFQLTGAIKAGISVHTSQWSSVVTKVGYLPEVFLTIGQNKPSMRDQTRFYLGWQVVIAKLWNGSPQTGCNKLCDLRTHHHVSLVLINALYTWFSSASAPHQSLCEWNSCIALHRFSPGMPFFCRKSKRCTLSWWPLGVSECVCFLKSCGWSRKRMEQFRPHWDVCRECVAHSTDVGKPHKGWHCFKSFLVLQRNVHKSWI